MTRPLVAGNWKMNTTRAEAVALAQGIARRAEEVSDAVDLLICPPAVYLSAAVEAVAGAPVSVGAQNCYFEQSGAFTGEISTKMLRDVGCTAVILGHSERRHLMGETDAQVNQKLHAVLAADLTPIVCVGELLEEREAGQTAEVIRTQFEGSLAGLSNEQAPQVVLAYEPVWAIGTGKVATPAQAEEVHADLRKLLEQRYNSEIAGQVRILYGGSVKPDNAREILAQPNVNGALVGGASLKVDDFLAIAAGAKA